MDKKSIKARAEIPHREWVELEVSLNPQGTVAEAQWRAKGCHTLLKETAEFSKQIKNKSLDSFQWEGHGHVYLMLTEVLEKLAGRYVEVADEEICHCRKVNRSTIDQMIVLGAHTPEKVKAWTTASSGCGTCRPEVQKLIDQRLGVRFKKGA